MDMGKDGRDFGDALASLARELPHLRDRDATVLIGKLRTLAVAEGQMPLAELADGLAASLIRDRAATPIGAWIDAMRQAAAIRDGAAAAGPLLLATIGVRLSH